MITIIVTIITIIIYNKNGILRYPNEIKEKFIKFLAQTSDRDAKISRHTNYYRQLDTANLSQMRHLPDEPIIEQICFKPKF